MPTPNKFKKFRDVMEEIRKTGHAIYVDPAGGEDLVILSPYKINYVHRYAEDSKFFLELAKGKLM